MSNYYYSVPKGEIRAGDIILYYDEGELAHTGIVIHIPEDESLFCPWILSKWGSAGEYIHRYNYSPYEASHVQFMREGRDDCGYNP